MVMLIAATPSARAVDFNFNWTGTVAGETIVVNAVLDATFVSGTTWDVNSVSGTVTQATVNSRNFAGTITPGLGPATLFNGGTSTFRQQFLTSGGDGPSGHYLNPTPGILGGFSFKTATHDFYAYSDDFGGSTEPPPLKWSDSKYGFSSEEDWIWARDTSLKRSSRSYVRWMF